MMAWNKGKCVGPMKPRTPEQVQGIKHLIEAEGGHRVIGIA